MPLPGLPPIHFAIVTILQEEFRPLLRRFPVVRTESGAREYNLSEVHNHAGFTYNVATVAAVEEGTGEAQNVTHDVLDDLNPQWILVVGIAGGRPSHDFTLGDVVLATRIYDYTVNAQLVDQDTEYSVAGGPVLPEVSHYVVNLPAIEDRLGAWNDSTEILAPRPDLDLSRLSLAGEQSWQEAVRDSLQHHFEGGHRRSGPIFLPGPIASSDSLMKDPLPLISWLKTARRILAVEMEAAGVYRAVRRPGGEIPTLSIRAVSDIVGLKRDDAWKTYACNVAASFTRRFIEAFPAARLGEPRGRLAQRTSEPGHDIAEREAKKHLVRLRGREKKILNKRGSKRGRFVGRSQLDVLIGAARAKASESIVNLGGDLTWIEGDLETLRAVRIAKPQVKMLVFFDRFRTSSSLAPVLRQLEQMGVELRAYPPGFTAKPKCMLIDRESGLSRLYTFDRVPPSPVSSTAEKSQEFVFREHEAGDTLEMARSLVKLLDSMRTEPIKVAICGANNVGKSKLVTCLVQQLSTHFEVDPVGDIFREQGAGTSPIQNYIMLWKQREKEQKQVTSAIRVFDRTVVDNLCFLAVREGHNGLYASLAPEIAAHARGYDLLVDVRRKDANYTEETGRTKPEERQRVRKYLDDFFVNYGLHTYKVETDSANLEASIRHAADRLAAEVREIAIRRRMSRR